MLDARAMYGKTAVDLMQWKVIPSVMCLLSLWIHTVSEFCKRQRPLVWGCSTATEHDTTLHEARSGLTTPRYRSLSTRASAVDVDTGHVQANKTDLVSRTVLRQARNVHVHETSRPLHLQASFARLWDRQTSHETDVQRESVS